MSTKKNEHKNTSEQSYEHARNELITVVEQLERGGLDLESSIMLWERGEKLVQYCRGKLQGASERIEKILTTHKDENDKVTDIEVTDIENTIK